MSEIQTIEQLARDAGWIETTLFESREGDQVLILASGVSGIADRFDGHHVAVTQPDGGFMWELSAEPILRAPRPEPEWKKPGTVVWGHVYGRREGQALTRRSDATFPWGGVDIDGYLDSWSDDAVEVDHVIAYPDGSTPAPVLGPVTDEQLLTALNARVRESADMGFMTVGYSSLEDCPAIIRRLTRVELEAYRDTLLVPALTREVTTKPK